MSEILVWVAILALLSLLLSSSLAYEAYRDYFFERAGRRLQKPGILNKFSPYHIVSADIFRAKAQTDMSAYLKSTLVFYRISVIFFYSAIALNIAYWVFARNIFGLQIN